MRYADIEIVDMCKICELGKTYPSHGVKSDYEDGSLIIDIRQPYQIMAAIHTLEYWRSKKKRIDDILIEGLGPTDNRINITDYRTKKKNYIFVPSKKEKIEALKLLSGYNEFLSREEEKGREITFPINVYFLEINSYWEERVAKQNGLFEYAGIKFLSSEDASNRFNKRVRHEFGNAKKGKDSGIKIICPLEKVVLKKS